MSLKTTIRGRIARPAHDVFEAVADPSYLSRYFATGAGTAGRLVAGTSVTWEFHDFPGAFPVKVLDVIPDKKIVVAWGSGDDAAEGETFTPHDNIVTFEFEQLEDGRTLVSITEEGWSETPKGIKGAIGNTEGWTGMLAALKVWLEHGINLRDGFYK